MIAISTAFSQALLAIDIDGKQDFAQLQAKKSEEVLFQLDRLLDKNLLSIGQNDAFAVVVGPGSFTGLRVGVSLVKGLCDGGQNGCKVVALSSLQLMARQYLKDCAPKSDFVCAINALSGLVFVCRFSKNGQKLDEEKIMPCTQFDQLDVTKVGLSDEDICQQSVQISPQTLLEEANRAVRARQEVDVKSLAPVYLRKSQAEDALEQKKMKNL